MNSPAFLDNKSRFITATTFALVVLLCGKVFSQQQAFTSTGSTNFTVPASVLELTVEAIGAGGAGGRVTPSNPLDTDAGGGGGGGAYAQGKVVVIPGSVYPVVVGAGGTNTGTSVDGSNSFFGDGTVVNAEGGKTRSGNDNTAGVAGGQAVNSSGTIIYNGGNGGNGNEGDADGGGGGGAAGSAGNGGNGSTITAGVRGSGNLLDNSAPGNGGNGGNDGANGTAGSVYGGGGGGSSANGSQNRNGGPGASGVVVLTWSEITGMEPLAICEGDVVTITGLNFINVTGITFNNISATTYTVNDATSITATVPVGTTVGDVVVTTEYGQTFIPYVNALGDTWYADTDVDGYGDPAVSLMACTQPTGYVANSDDCDDTNMEITIATLWYADTDVDNYGDPAVSVTACTQPLGYVADNTDCDDTNMEITIATLWYADTDVDNYGDPDVSITACTQPSGYVADNTDCDDTNMEITIATLWYADTDVDNYGDPAVSVTACTQPLGYVADNTDCDDTNMEITIATLWYADTDVDNYGDPDVSIIACTQPSGYVADNTDCDDTNQQLNVDCNVTEIFENETSFKIYPNPTTGLINISDLPKIFTIDMYDLLGQKVFSCYNKNTIDISFLDNAIYQLRITNENGSVVKRIIKTE